MKSFKPLFLILTLGLFSKSVPMEEFRSIAMQTVPNEQNKENRNNSPIACSSPINDVLAQSNKKSSTPINAHVSTPIEEILKSPDVNKIPDIVKEKASEILEKELEEFFYREFTHQTPDNKSPDMLIVYDEWCRCLALAAIYSDATYHRSSLNLKLAFPKNRNLAKYLLQEMIKKSSRNPWIFYATALEMIRLEEIMVKEAAKKSGTPVVYKNDKQLIDSLIRVCDQTENIRAFIEANKLMIRISLKNPEFKEKTIAAIQMLTKYCKPGSMQYAHYTSLIAEIENYFKKETGTFFSKSIKKQIDAIEEIEKEKEEEKAALLQASIQQNKPQETSKKNTGKKIWVPKKK